MPNDIRLLISFKGHHKRKRLKRKLGDGYLDYLIDLWLSVGANKPSGILDGWQAEDIADYSGWEGDTHLFLRALIDSGFLDVHSIAGGIYTYKCHDWNIHQVYCIGSEERSEQARLAALIKHHGDKKGRKLFAGMQPETPINIEQVQTACPEDADSTCGQHAERNAPSLPSLPSLPTIPTLPKEKTFLSDSDEYRLSEQLFNLILQRNPNHKKPNLQLWAKNIDFMIRLDKRKPVEIEKIINWSQSDPFWQANILSTSKLREKYDALYLKMEKDNGTNRGNSKKSGFKDAREPGTNWRS